MKVTFRKNKTVYNFFSVQPGQLFAIESVYDGVGTIKVYMKLATAKSTSYTPCNSVLLLDTRSSENDGELEYITDHTNVIPVDECELTITLRS